MPTRQGTIWLPGSIILFRQLLTIFQYRYLSAYQIKDNQTYLGSLVINRQTLAKAEQQVAATKKKQNQKRNKAKSLSWR